MWVCVWPSTYFYLSIFWFHVFLVQYGTCVAHNIHRFIYATKSTNRRQAKYNASGSSTKLKWFTLKRSRFIIWFNDTPAEIQMVFHVLHAHILNEAFIWSNNTLCYSGGLRGASAKERKKNENWLPRFSLQLLKYITNLTKVTIISAIAVAAAPITIASVQSIWFKE